VRLAIVKFLFYAGKIKVSFELLKIHKNKGSNPWKTTLKLLKNYKK
jgi:hypothetical protein